MCQHKQSGWPYEYLTYWWKCFWEHWVPRKFYFMVALENVNLNCIVIWYFNQSLVGKDTTFHQDLCPYTSDRVSSDARIRGDLGGHNQGNWRTRDQYVSHFGPDWPIEEFFLGLVCFGSAIQACFEFWDCWKFCWQFCYCEFKSYQMLSFCNQLPKLFVFFDQSSNTSDNLLVGHKIIRIVLLVFWNPKHSMLASYQWLSF